MSENLLASLNNHSVFKKLSERLKSKSFSKSLRLLTYRNDIIYVWNEWNKCVDSVDIKDVIKRKEEADILSFQPRPSLYFDVESVYVNSTSTFLCIYGSAGVSVSKLPDRWLLKENMVELVSDCLAQRVFVCDHSILRCISWHPGSPSDSHLLMLTSDEVLRLYNVLDCTLIWQCRLTERTLRRNLVGKVGLGETPIYFDFGFSERPDEGDIVWPVYVVWGDGDLYRVDTRLEDSCSKVEGPIRYKPMVEDNYGSDASSVILLDSSPPVVVIATCNGLLLHCLLFRDDAERVLHVVERIELELGIVNYDDKEDDIVSCPIRLVKDPNQVSRYFCLHDAGIHSVTTPLVDKLMKLEEEGVTSFDSYKLESTIDYLLCTSLTGEIQRSPTLGIAFIDTSKILALLSGGDLIQIPLFYKCKAPLDTLNLSKDVDLNKSDDYEIIVESLLKEKGISTFPLIKLCGDVKPNDLLKIVTRTTGSLRSVLKCHSDVALKIQQKVELLKLHLTRQVEWTEKLNNDKSSLRSTAEQIAEKYEEINEKQNELLKRTEKLLLKMECDSGRTTANEKKMTDLLEKAKSKVKRLESDIAAVQSFYSRLEQTSTKHNEDKDVYLGNNVQILYKNIKHLNNEIADTAKRVKKAQETCAEYQFHNG